MLVSLRLRFADRPDVELAVEQPNREVDARQLLQEKADSEGRIALGDRDWCRIEDVVDVTVVRPQPLEGPGFERGLQDESVAAALDENFEPPPGS